MRTRFDVIVVGGGHNGLVCACYLAAAGVSVCVLERHAEVGGAAVTEEFYPGFRNSVASYTVSLLQRRIIEELALRSHGLRIVPRPLANFVPSRDGAGLALPSDAAAASAAIAEHSRRDAERYAAFCAERAAVAGLVRPLLLEAPVDPSLGPREWLRAAVRLARFSRAPSGTAAALWQLLTGSAGHWLDGWFESDLLKGGLGFDSIVGHFASPYDPGSGYLLLHHALGDALGEPGVWGHAIGGMGAISRALARAARARGVEIRTGCTVERIEPVRAGFEIETAGSTYAARAVAGAVHPQLLFGRLIAREHLPEPFAERIDRWRSESATLRINVALSELPDFTCRPGRTAAEHHGAGILIAPSLGYLERAHTDARSDGWSRAPVIELLVPSTIDDTLAPPNAHVASLFCQHFRRRLPEGGWDEHKDAAVRLAIETVNEYAPNFAAAVLAVQALTPEDLERRFGLVGGDIFHGALTLDQLYWARPALGYSQYRTPLRGLYLSASGAHPGGGVTGAPGYNAARAMLADRARWPR